MIQLRRILIAQDFSPVSERAAAFALQIARTHGADVHILTVDVVREDLLGREQGHNEDLESVGERFREEGQRLLEATKVHADEMSVENVIIRDVAAAPAIVRYAEDHDIDLIVTGTHGRRGFRLALLGSVAAEVVRTAPCPTLTVPSRNGLPSEKVRHILVPVDFSSPSRGAVLYAARLAESLNAQLTVAHVLETIDAADIYGFKPSVFGTSEGYKYVRSRLSRLARELPIEPELRIMDGRPADEITEFAAEYDVDLIIMPTRGRAGLERFLMGSVAERVISTSPCPVLSAKKFDPYLLSEKVPA